MTPNPIAVCSKKGDQAGLSQAIHGTWERLGQNEMVVERSLSWLHQLRKLRMREETLASTHEALMLLACVIIAHRHLKSYSAFQLHE